MKRIFLMFTVVCGSITSAQSLLDPNFVSGTGLNSTVKVIVEGPNHTIYVGGEFTQYDDETQNRIVRLNMDGTIDASFDIGTGFNNTVRTIALQADGKLLVGGEFTEYNSIVANRIIRLNPDGTIDNTFPTGAGNGCNNHVTKIKIKADGKILVGGHFSHYKGEVVNQMMLLETNGDVNNIAFYSRGFAGNVNDFVEANGGYLVVGEFTKYDGRSFNNIVRLQNNGSAVSSSFMGSNAYINVIAEAPDGKFYIGGEFSDYNGVAVNRLARIDETLAVDPSFDIGTGASSIVQQIKVDANGIVYVVGNFTVFNSNSGGRHFVTLNPDGSMRVTAGLELFGSAATVLEFHSTGGIFFGGAFHKYGSTDLNRIAKLKICYGLINDTITELISGGVQANQLQAYLSSPNYTYRWTNCEDDSELQNSNVSTYTYTTPGSYGLEIFYGNCKVTSDCYEVTSMQDPGVSVDNVQMNDFTMYPNPTAGDVYLQFNTTQTDFTVEIMDMVGRVMSTRKVESAENLTFNLEGAAGIYLVRVTSANGEIIKKVIRK